MAKRKAGVNDIIYELDNDDIEISSDDEIKETKIARFAFEAPNKQSKNANISERKCTEVINLDCSSDSLCDTLSPNVKQNGGKTTQTNETQKNFDEHDKNTNDDSQNNTLIFHEHIVVDSPTSNSDLGVVGCENRTPLVTVRFKDRNLAHIYKQKVKKFLINLLKSHSDDSVSVSGDSDIELDIWPEELFDEEFDKVGEEFEKVGEVEQQFNQVVENEFDQVDEELDKVEEIEGLGNADEIDDTLFFVDTAPCDNTKVEVPKYRQNSSIISNIIEEAEEDCPPAKFRRGPTCFNCDGSHSLKDCPIPKNYTRIAAKRKTVAPRVGRYHVEDEQKYGHLVPGSISGNLRHALGLKRCELPLHVYRMRLLGYPPGWLEEARISHSGITLFDSTGNATQDPEEEDGELCEPGSKDKFDIKKILDFPGFNVPASSRYAEEAHLFGLPPMSEQDSKLGMLQALAPNAMKAYKRKKLTFFPSANANLSQAGQAEMELDSGDELAEFPSVPPLPDEEPPKAPPPPPPPPSLPPPPPPTPPPEDEPKEIKTPADKPSMSENVNIDKSKNNQKDNSKSKDKKKIVAVKEKEDLKEKCELNLVSSSDDELEIIEVVQVVDIPVPEHDLITIDEIDDDSSPPSSRPSSPSLDALEERKRRLIDALKRGDVTLESDDLDELPSNIVGTIGNNKENKLETDEQIETKENSKLEPEKSVVQDDNDRSSINEEVVSINEEAVSLNEEVVSINEELVSSNEEVISLNEEVVSINEGVVNINEEVVKTPELMDAETSDCTEPEESLIVNNEIQTTENVHVDKELSSTKEKGVATPDSKTGHVKDTSFGTPVINVASPFVKLPSEDKFAKDICDVINYENLPNSIGKYKQISSLLKKVKSAVDKIQDS